MDKIEEVKELLRRAFAILASMDAPNIRSDLELLSAHPEPSPLPLVPVILGEPVEDE